MGSWSGSRSASPSSRRVPGEQTGARELVNAEVSQVVEQVDRLRLAGGRGTDEHQPERLFVGEGLGDAGREYRSDERVFGSAGSPVNDDLDHGGEGRAGVAAEAAVAVRDERGAARARGTERQRGVAAAGGTGCEVFAPAVKAERQHAPGEASLFFVARGLLAQTALDTRSCGCP
jgi:hypothetical protein